MKIYQKNECRDLNAEEITAMQAEHRKWELFEKSRPLTADEVSRLFLMQNINSIITDDATASRAVDFHPTLKEDGSLISAGTRINWNGTLKRAAVDLWDTAENNPENAPTLWADLAYRNGIRIIPEVITVPTAFSKGEPGWWSDGYIYRSKVDSNVYTPAVRPEDWEKV